MKSMDIYLSGAAISGVLGAAFVTPESYRRLASGVFPVSFRSGTAVRMCAFMLAFLAFEVLTGGSNIANARQNIDAPESSSSIEALPIEERVGDSDISVSMASDKKPTEKPSGSRDYASADVLGAPPPPSVSEATPDVPPVQALEAVPEEKASLPAAPLASPGEAPAATEAQGLAQTGNVPRPDTTPDVDSYYDSLPLPPPDSLARKTAGPREVNPRLEPASKFVVVTKDQDATGFEALLVSANRALALGRYEAAVDLFDQLLRKNSRDRRVLMGRAIALQKAGRVEAARMAYEGLLNVAPDALDAQVNMLGLVAQDYPSVALRRMLDLRKKWPQDAGLAAQIGLTQARLGNDSEALDYLGMAASLDPSDAEHLFNMAVVADRLGDKDQAVKLYEQALQTDTLHGGGRSIPRDTVYSRLSALRDQ